MTHLYLARGFVALFAAAAEQRSLLVRSVHLLAYEMLCHRAAFNAESLAALHVRTLKGRHTPFSDGVSPRARSFVRALLTVDEAERPTAPHAARRAAEAFGLAAVRDAPVRG